MYERGKLELTNVKELTEKSDDDVKEFFKNWNAANSAVTSFSEVDYFAREAFAKLVGARSSQTDLAPVFLETVRIFSRDKNGIDVILTDEVGDFILDCAMLKPSPKSTGIISCVLEALKCLVNSLFHSKKMRTMFDPCAPTLFKRLSAFAKSDFSWFEWIRGVEDSGEIWYFDLRIAFIVTAHSRAIQASCAKDDDVIKALLFPIQKAIVEFKAKGSALAKNDKDECRANEALKVLFNILCHVEVDILTEVNQEQLVALNVLLRDVVVSGCSDATVEGAVNLFATPPVAPHVPTLCAKIDESKPELTPQGRDDECFDNHNMAFTTALLSAMTRRLDGATDDKPQENVDLLSTYLTALIRLCTVCKQARRYCRLKILPPLKGTDVETRPDEGLTLRNKLVRIMTQPTCAKELASEFLFILCKRSVPRLIKYTGFGHSAGLLANAGLLGSINQPKRDSDSEDSETDEYNAVKDHVNPVTGTFYSPDRGSALAGMSEEQKEFEAMKLLDAMNRMMNEGIVKPGTIGEDGTVREVSHVLELAKNFKDEKTDSSDDD